VGVPVQLLVNGQPRDLGEVRGIRTYDLAAASDAQGDITLRLQSGTAKLGNDPRLLGLLLDRITVRALGSAPPPFQLVLSVLLVLARGAAGFRERAGAAVLGRSWELQPDSLVERGDPDWCDCHGAAA